MEITLMLYYPMQEKFTYAYTFDWYGESLSEIKQHTKYHALLNVARATEKNPYAICVLEGNLWYENENKIKSRCKLYCKNQTDGDQAIYLA